MRSEDWLKYNQLASLLPMEALYKGARVQEPRECPVASMLLDPFGLSTEPGSKAQIRSVFNTGDTDGHPCPKVSTPNYDSTLILPYVQWVPFIFLPPGAPLRTDFAKSFWDLEIQGQSCWGRKFSWTDMLPKHGAWAAGTIHWVERVS